MSHANKKSLVKQIEERYTGMLAIGNSKHFAKINNETSDKIFSWSTFNAYIKHANYFAAYCKEKYSCKTIDECRQYVDEWLQSRIDANMSAYTIKLEASALAKLYGCSTTDFMETPDRNRKDIKRSRGEKVRDAHFSEKNHKELVDFCRSTGLRRRELSALTGDKLLKKDGKYYIKVDKAAKGGRYRETEVIGNIENVKNLMTDAKKEKVFQNIPSGADIHEYRSDYATALYHKYARPIESIEDRHEIYCFRKDRAGIVLDRKAMQKVSVNLGHSRISVVAGHYIREMT